MYTLCPTSVNVCLRIALDRHQTGRDIFISRPKHLTNKLTFFNLPESAKIMTNLVSQLATLCTPS